MPTGALIVLVIGFVLICLSAFSYFNNGKQLNIQAKAWLRTGVIMSVIGLLVSFVFLN